MSGAPQDVADLILDRARWWVQATLTTHCVHCGMIILVFPSLESLEFPGLSKHFCKRPFDSPVDLVAVPKPSRGARAAGRDDSAAAARPPARTWQRRPEPNNR